MDAQKRIYPTETHELCFALLDAGYQSEAAGDPEKWNDSLTEEQKTKGYLWENHPSLGWYPNPGRIALVEEIKKLISDDAFKAKYGNTENIHQIMSHEAWMREWLMWETAPTGQINP